VPRPAADETALIRLIQRTIGIRGRVRLGIGDDACLLKDGTVITTDAYRDGVHFDPGYMTYRDIGMRCACAAISDVVAMAAIPQVLLVALALPRVMGTSQVRSLYRGIEDACSATGCEVAGGDIIRSDRLFLALTATGRTRRPRFRSAARPGDKVYVTGHVGLAEAGRLALEHGFGRRHFGRAIRRHVSPVPRLATMKAVAPRMHALIDTSDGLATDARHVAGDSNARIVLEPDRFPVLEETRSLCRRLKLDLDRFVLSAGEDYELLFTSRAVVKASVEDVPVARIGRVEHGTGLFSERSGKVRPVRVRGYDHFKSA